MNKTMRLWGLIAIGILSSFLFIYSAETESIPEQTTEQAQVSTDDETTTSVDEKIADSSKETTEAEPEPTASEITSAETETPETIEAPEVSAPETTTESTTAETTEAEKEPEEPKEPETEVEKTTEAEQATDLAAQIKQYQPNTKTTIDQLFTTLALDKSKIDEFASTLQSLVIIDSDAPVTIISVTPITGGYQLAGETTFATEPYTLVARIIADEQDQRSYALVVQAKKNAQRTYGISTFFKQFIPLYPEAFSNTLAEIDKLLTTEPPIVAISTISDEIPDAPLDLPHIKPGCSIGAYIPDGSCLLCTVKKDSGLKKLGVNIYFEQQPTSPAELMITPLYELDPQKNLCLLKIATKPLQAIFEKIGAQNKPLEKLLDALSFCFANASIGSATDDNDAPVFYVTGTPTMPAPDNRQLGKHGMLKVSLQNGFSFVGGVLLGDDMALGLRGSSFAAKLGDSMLAKMNEQLVFNNPFLSVASAPGTLFDIDLPCNKVMSADPQKREDQLQQLADCHEKKGIKDAKPFDFTQIRTIDPGIIFDVDVTAKPGSAFEKILKPLRLQQSKMRLYIPTSGDCFSRDNIKLQLIPVDQSPLKIDEIFGDQVKKIIEALPAEIPLAKDIQQLTFKPSVREFDVNAKGKPIIIIKGTIGGSPLLGDVGFELYRQEDRTVVALLMPQAPKFNELFGDKFASFFEPITQSFVPTNTLITFVTFNNEDDQTAQMSLFGSPHTIKRGLTIRTIVEVTDSTPKIIKKVLEKTGLHYLSLDIQAFKATKDAEHKTLAIEMYPTSAPASTEQPTDGVPDSSDTKTCQPPSLGIEGNPGLIDKPAPAPAQFCPITLISETLSSLGVDQLLAGIGKDLCLSVKLFYTHDGTHGTYTVNGYSQQQNATFTYKNMCGEQECHSAFGFKIKKLAIPGIELIVDNPIITYNQSKEPTDVFGFNEQTLNADSDTPVISAPSGLSVTIPQFCPFNLIQSLTSSLPETLKNLCVHATAQISKEKIFIDGASDDQQTHVTVKVIKNKTGTSTTTMAIKVAEFKTDKVIDITLKNPTITYTNAIQDTLFADTDHPLTISKGFFVAADVPDDWEITQDLKKYITRINFDPTTGAIAVEYQSGLQVCLKNFIKDDFIPDFLKNMCFVPQRTAYNQKERTLEISAQTTIAGTPTSLIIKIGKKTFIHIKPEHFSFEKLPSPLDKIGDILDVKNGSFVYSSESTTLSYADANGIQSMVNIPRGIMLLGDIKLKGVLDDLFGKLVQDLHTMPLSGMQEVKVSGTINKDLGIFELKSIDLVINPNDITKFTAQLDTTLPNGVPFKFSGSGSASGFTFQGTIACQSKEKCEGIDLNSIHLPIAVTPLAPGSPDCPGLKQEKGKEGEESGLTCSTTECKTCRENGLPLTLKIGIAGGVPKQLGISGLFNIADQKFYVDSDFDAKKPQNFGLDMQTRQVCLEKVVDIVGKFLLQGQVSLPKMPPILCFTDVTAQMAIAPHTVGQPPHQKILTPGAQLQGNFHLFDHFINGFLGLCIRTPISRELTQVGTDAKTDICHMQDKDINFGVFAKGFVDPIELKIGDRSLIKLTHSIDAPTAPGAGIDLDISLTKDKTTKVRAQLNGQLVVLDALKGDFLLDLKLDEGILHGKGTLSAGKEDKPEKDKTKFTTDITINITSPLDSIIDISTQNVGVSEVIELISDLAGAGISIPKIPDIVKINRIRLHVGKSAKDVAAETEERGFGVEIFANIEVLGQVAKLDGYVGEDGLYLKGELDKVKFLNNEDLLTIVDAKDASKGPSIEINLTRNNPSIRISGKAVMIKGLISAEMFLWTRKINANTLRSDTEFSTNVVGLAVDFLMEQQISINPDGSLSFDTWTITGKITDNLTDKIMSAFNLVFKPIKDLADIAYGQSYDLISTMDSTCHKIPVIANVLCQPLTTARKLLSGLEPIYDQITTMAGPNILRVHYIQFKADLTQLKNVTDLSKFELPELKFKITILGNEREIKFANVTIPKLPEKLGQLIIDILDPQQLLNQITGIVSQLGNILLEILESVGEAIAGLAMEVFKWIGDLAVDIYNTGKEAVEAAEHFGEDAIKTIGKGVQDLVNNINRTLNQMTQVFNQMTHEITHLANDVAKTLENIAHEIERALGQVARELEKIASQIGDFFKSIF